MCQRGRSPDFILRTHSVYWISYFTCIVYLITSASSLPEFVLLCENPGANPAWNKCLKNIIRVQVRLSPVADLVGSLFSRLWCDGGTNHELCYVQTSWGQRGLLGWCLAAPHRGNGKPCSGLQQCALGLAGFAKAWDLRMPITALTAGSGGGLHPQQQLYITLYSLTVKIQPCVIALVLTVVGQNPVSLPWRSLREDAMSDFNFSQSNIQ